MRRLLISFSGGETSAYLVYLCLTMWRDKWDEIVIVFANTGEENEETLEFVHQCDLLFQRLFGLAVVWVEAVVHHGKRRGTTHRIVNISTASRKGEPYEEHIKKYGIPNKKFPHCTRELKQRPIRSYMRSIGWGKDYATAVGIRADEAHRRSPEAKDKRIIYPLLDWLPTTKPEVNKFWMGQAFRLNLMGYQGNCRTCWKKSLRKLLTIMDESPEKFDFMARMEERYSLVGPEFKKGVKPGYKRVFFRGRLSTTDLRETYERTKDTLVRAADDAVLLPDELMDAEEEGCIETCEVTA